MFTRREFLKTATTLMATSPFILWCERARSMTPFAFWKKRSTSGGGSSTYPADTGDDPYWDYVTLCMNMDTPTPSTGFTTVFADESNAGKTPTISGSPSTDSSQVPFAGAAGSSYFNGSSDYLTFPSSTDFSFDGGSFTIECRLRFTSLPSNGRTLFTRGSIPSPGTASNLMMVFTHDGDGWTLRYSVSTDTTHYTNISWAFTPTLNTWYHLALVRDGQTMKLFINGSLQTVTVGTASIGSVSLASSTAGVQIGNSTLAGTNAYFNGHIFDYRIYNGIAKYTANFTPPTTPIGLGTANDKYWGYCVLACPFENSLKDMSGLRATPTGATLSTADKKFGTASLTLNGSGNYISCGNTSAFEFTDGDFTVEFFIKPSSTNTSGTQRTIISKRITASNTGLAIRQLDSQINFHFEGAGIYGTSGSLTGDWQHVAVCRRGFLWSLYIDGVLNTSSYNATSIPTNSGELCIGKDPDTSLYYAGLIDSIRVTKGFARYTANFTPPAASFPVSKDETVDPFWTNTLMYFPLSGSNGSTTVIDSTGRHTATLSGTGQISTTVSKWNTGAMKLYTNGDRMALDSNLEYYPGNGDFTIELWIYPMSSGAGVVRRLGSLYNVGQWGVLDFQIKTDNKVRITFSWANSGNDIDVSSANTMSYDSWHHIAFVRRGATAAIYVDGISWVSASVGTNSVYSNDRVLTIGALAGDSSETLFSYVNDYRFTKGVARYVNNFTPPTRAFATTPVSTYTDYDPLFSSVALLLPMNGTNGSTSILDSSSSAKTITSNGSAALSTSNKKYGSASLALNGSSQYLSASDSSDWDFGSGDFTIEAWVSFTSTSGLQVIATQWQAGVATNCAWSFYLSSNTLYFDTYTGSTLTRLSGSWTPSTGTWYHLSVTRSSGTIRCFANGASIFSGSNSNSINNSTNALTIGSQQSSYLLNGYIDDLRITKGFARYTASFAPPSKALPTSAGIVTSGLVALLDAGDAASYDGSSQTWKSLNQSRSTTAAKSGTQGMNTPYCSFSTEASARLPNGATVGALATLQNLACSGTLAIVELTSGSSFAVRASVNFSHTGSDTFEWFELSSSYTVPASGDFYIATYVSNSASVTRSIHTATSRAHTSNSTWTVGTSFSTTLDSNDWTYCTAWSSQPPYDFYRGSSSSSEGSDPAFVGVPGGRSINDYFSFDGGDYLKIATGNTSFIHSWHKPGSAFTLSGWFFLKTSSAQILFNTAHNGGHNIGIIWQSTAFYADNGVTTHIVRSNPLTIPLNQWAYYAVTMDDATSTMSFYINGAYSSHGSISNATGSSSSSYGALTIGANPDGTYSLADGSRMASAIIYNRALSKAELDQNFNAVRGRFGI